MLTLSNPTIIERGPYKVVGVYATIDGDDEGPGWAAADRQFFARLGEITNRSDNAVLGFLYRPHTDHPSIAESVRACFIGVEVSDLDHVPQGMATTQFSGGQYVIVACTGDTQVEASAGVGEAIGYLSTWIPEHGYSEGDACFACSPYTANQPPYIEHVYIKIEQKA